MSSTPKETPPKPSDKTDKPAHAESHAESKKEQSKPDSKSESHAVEPPDKTARAGVHTAAPDLNQGRVHPEGHEPPVHEPEKARLHMDQIDAVATPQGVVLFALTEGGEIWQLTTPGGQPVWHQILTPEAPPEDA